MARTTLWLLACLFLSVVSASCSRDGTRQVSTPGPQAYSPATSQTDGPPEDVVQTSALQVDLCTPGVKSEALVTRSRRVTTSTATRRRSSKSQQRWMLTRLMGSARERRFIHRPFQRSFHSRLTQSLLTKAKLLIKQPLETGADATKGNRTLRAKLRVQPCDD